MSKIVGILDVETSGLGYNPGETRSGAKHNGARVVEVGAVVIDFTAKKPRALGKFQALCNPGRQHIVGTYHDGAFAVNGISRRDVLAAEPDRIVARQLRSFLREHCVEVLTAYNIGFDSKFLNREPFVIRDVAPWTMCIMDAARAYVNKYPRKFHVVMDRADGTKGSPKLEVIARHFDLLTGEQTHRADDDAVLAARVGFKLMRRGFWTP